MPYLLDTKIKVKFDGIKINTERQLFEGKLVTTYDKTESNVLIASEQLRKISEDIKKLAQKKREETEAIFGEQGEEYEKELQEWAEEEYKKRTEIAQLEVQNGMSNNSIASSSGVSENNVTADNSLSHKVDDIKQTNSGNEPYYIEYEGKKYYDGDVLKLPYKRGEHKIFTMGKLPDSTTINWTLYQRGADKKILESYSKTKNKGNGKVFNFTKKESDIATLLSVEAQAETEGNPKVEIFIEKEVKEFKYNELRAIDNENKNRVAKSGETLYYVHQTGKSSDTRSTKFQIDISPKVDENEIPTNHIEWIYNGTNTDHDKLSLSRTIHYNDKNKGKIEVQARTGNPMVGEYKKVNVEWVDNYTLQVDIVPAGIKNALKILSDYVNNVSSVLKKIDKTGELQFNISFQGQETLEEDDQTRFYNTVRHGGFSGSIDFAFKGFKYGADLKIAKAEIFVKPIIGLTVDAKMRQEKRNDKKDFTNKGIIMNFGLQADLQTGGEVGIDIKVLNFSVNPYAGISSWGKVEYSNVRKTIEGKIGIGKPYVGLKGELKLGGYNIIPNGDIKKIWEDIKIEETFNISTDESRN